MFPFRARVVSVAGLLLYSTALAGTLDLSMPNPFAGPWSFTPLADPTISMAPLSQAFVTIIPEPGAVAMLLAGALAAAAGGRRRRRRG